MSIGNKIFGIALCMLLFLAAVAFLSHQRLSRISAEISDQTKYIIPISHLVEEVVTHFLNQQLHFERAMGLYQERTLNLPAIKAELKFQETAGAMVDEAIKKSSDLSRAAVTSALSAGNREEFARLGLTFERLEKEHQEFHDHLMTVLSLIEHGEMTEAEAVEIKLEKEEDDLELELEGILLQSEQFVSLASNRSVRMAQEVLWLNLSVTTLAVLIGLIFATVVSLGIVRPLEKLLVNVRKIGTGDSEFGDGASSKDEIGILIKAFSHMASELDQKEKIKSLFGKYVDPRIVERLIDHPEAAGREGEKRTMTVFFSDITHFAKMTEHLSPDEQVKITNHYLTSMAKKVSDQKGVIDKFIGTMVMAFWGPPFTAEKDQAWLACHAALNQSDAISAFRNQNATSAGTDLSSLELHVGLSTGPLVVGNMGSQNAKSYTVMGDTVNIASRLKGASKQYGVRVMMTEETRALAGEQIETREVDLIQVLGKEEPIRVYELLARSGELSEQMTQVRQQFGDGLAAYRSQDWSVATGHFEACLELKSDDAPSEIFLKRIEGLKGAELDDDWNGAWQLSKK